MKVLVRATRENVYNAPTIPWNNGTYTPISNKFVMDMVEDKIRNLGLSVRNEEYKASVTQEGLIKGVIGSYNLISSDGSFGPKVMFRNSYDKSMSFAFVSGLVVFICENGCVKGDYEYKRIHRGVLTNGGSTTQEDIVDNVTDGFKMLEPAFGDISKQLRELQHFEISPTETYDIIGKLFFEQQVITITQLSTIKKEFEYSQNFRHLGDTAFTAYDLYNHITESLKSSAPRDYISNHADTHKLFEEIFSI